MFKAVLIEKDERGYRADVAELPDSRLPDGEVTVEVEFSTLNYKDGLAITGKGPIVRSFPLVPGIDFAGVVSSSSDPTYTPGDRVVLNGWGVGEQHWGGLAQRAKVKADRLIKLPPSMPSRRAMIIGTAGYTAMLSVVALEKYGIRPGAGDVLVTGAGGGVGSMAIMLLHKLGFPSWLRPADRTRSPISRAWALPRSSTGHNCRSPASRCRRNDGSLRSTL